MLQNVIKQTAHKHQEYYQLLEEAFEANPQVFQAIIGFHKTHPYVLGNTNLLNNVVALHLYIDNIFVPSAEGKEWLNDIKNNNFQFIEAIDTLNNKQFYFANSNSQFYQINENAYIGHNFIADEKLNIDEEAKKVQFIIHNDFTDFIDSVNQYQHEQDMRLYSIKSFYLSDLSKPKPNSLKLSDFNEIENIIQVLKNDFILYFQQRIEDIAKHGNYPKYEENSDYIEYLIKNGKLPSPNANFNDNPHFQPYSDIAKHYIGLFAETATKPEFINNHELDSLIHLYYTLYDFVHTSFDDGDLCFEYQIKNNKVQSIELKSFESCHFDNPEFTILNCSKIQSEPNPNVSKLTI